MKQEATATFVKSVREKTGLSQSKFAKLIDTPKNTYIGWEQGKYPPPGIAILLLKMVMDDPKILGS